MNEDRHSRQPGTVVSFEAHCAARARRQLPLFDPAAATESRPPDRPARGLSEREVVHRQRMLRHLVGR